MAPPKRVPPPATDEMAPARERVPAADPDANEALRQTLQALPEVDIAQLDLQWLNRLLAIMEIGQRGTLLLAAMRSAVLWRQCGGTSFGLLLGRRKLADTAAGLLQDNS